MYEIEVNYAGFTGFAGGNNSIKASLSGSLETIREYIEVLSGQINHEITGLEGSIHEIISGIFGYIPAAAQIEIYNAFTSTELDFCCDLVSGNDFHYVGFPTGMVCAPNSVSVSLNNDIDDYLYSYKIKDVSASGFGIIFSENLYADYQLCVYARVSYTNMLEATSNEDLDKY